MTSATVTPQNTINSRPATFVPRNTTVDRETFVSSVGNPSSIQSDIVTDRIRRICEKLSSSVSIQAIYYRSDSSKSPGDHGVRLLPENDAPNLASISRALDAACRVAQRTGTVQVQRQTKPDRSLLAISIDTLSHGRISIGLSIEGDVSNAILELIGTTIVSQFLSDECEVRQAELEREVAETAAVIEMLEDAIDASDLKSACQRLATKIQSLQPNSRVAIGYRRRPQNTCRLRAISGSASFDRNSALASSLEAFMNNLLDQKEAIDWPNTDRPLSDNMEVKVASAAGTECQSVIGVSLRCRDDSAVGAIVVLSNASLSESSNAKRFLSAAAPSIASILIAVERSEKSFVVSTMRSFHSSWNGRWKLAIVSLLTSICIGLCFPITYKISSPSLIEPVHRRYVAAPFDGTLARAVVRPGDMVKKGDLLARMDDREIRWKRAGVLADQNQSQKKRDVAQAAHNYADQQIAQLEIDRLDIDLKLLDDRVSHLEIASPIDGMVTSGDLARVEGAPLSVGQTMFEIAPLDQMIAEVAIADDQIAYTGANQTVEILLDAYPGQVWNAKIVKIRPRAEIRDNSNVFVAEVELDNFEKRLRPGMKGQAKIHSAKRPYGWILFHQPMEYLVKKLAW